MTVAELLQQLQAAYPALNAGALASWGPVFQKRLGKREGPALHDAYTDTVAEFQPTVRKPFPIPLDFERNMPSAGGGGGEVSRWGRPIRARMERQRKVVSELVDTWKRRQGLKILEVRGWRVMNACAFEAETIASARGWSEEPESIVLTAAQIEICEDRVISSERVRQFGPLPKDAETWRSQMQQAREAVMQTQAPR